MGRATLVDKVWNNGVGVEWGRKKGKTEKGRREL